MFLVSIFTQSQPKIHHYVLPSMEIINQSAALTTESQAYGLLFDANHIYRNGILVGVYEEIDSIHISNSPVIFEGIQ